MRVLSGIVCSSLPWAGSEKRGRRQTWPMPWFSQEKATPMKAISTLMQRLFGKHDRDHFVIDRTIQALGESDRELDRRLKMLRDQVDVYQRTSRQEAPNRG